MKLRKLGLGRYGHLSDVDITFTDSPALQIVVGANEAGKTTALSAIGDCLFRFPHRTPFDFLHPARDLRVSLTVQAQDGRQRTFVRRKGRADNDLFDDAERPCAETEIAKFLAGATRDRFRQVFGLDGEELRAGGRAILEGKGEAGAAILGAATGFHHLRDLLGRLESDASDLFGDRRPQRKFNQASQRYRDAHRRRDEARIDHAAWKASQDEIASLQASLAANADRVQALHAERTRLTRIRATSPARLALIELQHRLDAIGSVPDLPDDAAQQQRDAAAAIDQADRDLGRWREQLARVEQGIAALPAHPPILDVADTIDSLTVNRQRVAGAMHDRDEQHLVADQHAAAMRDEGRRLGLHLDADALADAIPTALDRGSVNAVLMRYQHLAGQQASKAQALTDAVSKLEEANAALAALPPIEPFDALRAAIDSARSEAGLDSMLADADHAVVSARSILATELAAMPLWTGDVDALAAAPVPMDADISRVTEALTAAQGTVRETAMRLAAHDRKLAELDAFIQADEHGGPLPTREAIAAARSQRDAAWLLIRRAYLDEGAPITPEEQATAELMPDVAAAFASLVEAADRLVDRRAAEQERIVEAEQRLRDRMREQALWDATSQQHRAAEAAYQAQLDAWHMLWQPAGIEPSDPAAMREWMQKRDSIRSKLAMLREAEGARTAMHERRERLRVALTPLLPETSQTASTADLLRAAETTCRAREHAATRRTDAVNKADEAKREHAKAAKAVEEGQAQLALWHADWTSAANVLQIPPAAPHEIASDALTIWDHIDSASRGRRNALQRIEQMTRLIDTFEADVQPVVAQVAPDLATLPPVDAVPELAQRLAAARQHQGDRTRLGREAAGIMQQIKAGEQDRQKADDVLDRLCAIAGVADNQALLEVLARWGERRELLTRAGERQRDLDRVNDGKSLAELAAEAEGIDADALPARIAAIDAELQDLHNADQASTVRLHDLRRDCAAMEQGRDAVGAQQTMEMAAAEMDEIAARYVPLRMAAVLLKAGIDRYRQTQQRPLLLEAGRLFNRLTDGRYDRLETDEDDRGNTQVIARQPDGLACPAGSLSEGTRDQLYLALRLAALKADAGATEPLPFIGDDLLVNFDDRRAKAALRVMSEFAASVTQVILFTHHDHIAAMADPGLATVHRLGMPALLV